MEKVRKKLIREKAVIAVYQYLLTNATDEEIENYLNNYYKPRMEDREVALCKTLVFNTISRIDEYKPLIQKKLLLIKQLNLLKNTVMRILINLSMEF